MTILEATVRGGQLILDSAVPLPDGTRVQVQVQVQAAETDPLLFLADNGQATGVRDLADQHNHYIYGTPPETK